MLGKSQKCWFSCVNKKYGRKIEDFLDRKRLKNHFNSFLILERLQGTCGNLIKSTKNPIKVIEWKILKILVIKSKKSERMQIKRNKNPEITRSSTERKAG